MESLDTLPDRARIVADLHRTVWRYLRALGADPASADDLAQETFLRVLRRPFEWRGRPAAAAYLRRAAKHAYLMNLRGAERRRARPLADAVDRAWERWRGDDADDPWLDALRRCLEALDEPSRALLAEKYAAGRSRAEIACAEGVGETAVKARLQRTRDKLRDCVTRRMAR